MPTDKITTRQIIGLIIIARISYAISNMPVLDFPPYNQDQWIMVLLSLPYTIIICSPLLFLSNRFNNLTLVGYIKVIYGDFLGKIICISYGLYFIIGVVNALALQTELVTSSILAEGNNIIIVTLVMLIACMYIVSRGVTCFLRGVDLLVPILLFVFCVLLIAGLNNVDFSFLLPILKDSKFINLNIGAIQLAFLFTDIFFLAMLVPELENRKSINFIFIFSISIALIILMIVVIVTQGTLGIEYARHSVFPFLIYTRLIDVLKIIERIDVIFVLTWILASTSRITILIYISTRVFREIFNKKEDEKLILYIVGLIAFMITASIIRVRPVVGIRKDFNLYLNILFSIFVILIPIITCIVYFFRRKSLLDAGLIENE